MTQTMQSKAVDGAMRIARLPADTILNLVPEGRANQSLSLVVDRADAVARGAAASILRNPELREDAGKREAATDERERALRLRVEAEAKKKDAEARAEEKKAEADKRRQEAAADAKRKREAAKKQEKQRKARAAETAENKKKSARAKARSTQEKTAKQAKVDRLGELETKAEALEVKEAAVRAGDEARRIKAAAQDTKAKRKSD